MNELKNFSPAQSGRTVIFLLAIVFLLFSGVVHTDIYAVDKIMRDPLPTGEGAVVNRTQLNFGMVSGHGNPLPQTFAVAMDGAGTFEWQVTSDKDWLICTPNYEATPQNVTAYVAGCQLTQGKHTSTITVSDDYDPTTPQTIDVNVTVFYRCPSVPL